MALDRSPEFLRRPEPIYFVTFREEFIKISLCLYSASSPHSLMPCLLTDQNLAHNFRIGSPKNISVKLFHNMTSGFREDFLGICSCSSSESSPHSIEPCLMTNQNFTNNFWSLMERFCEIISKFDQRFTRKSLF